MKIPVFYAVFVGSTVLSSALLHAGACDIVNASSQEEARIKIGRQLKTLPSDGVMALRDCSDLEVVGGRIELFAMNSGVPESIECNALAPKPCSLQGNGTSLIDVAPYVPDHGGNNMSGSVLRSSGIPSGSIYDPQAAARFDFSATPEAARFTLMESRSARTVHSSPIDAGRVSVRAENLRRETKYQWEISDAGGRALAKGSFKLVSEGEAAQIRTELAAASAGNPPKAKQLMDELKVYYAHDLAHELKQLQTELGSMQR